MPLKDKTPKTVRCPECKKTFREYVDDAVYRRYITTRFDYLPMICPGCLKNRADKAKETGNLGDALPGGIARN